MQTTQELMNKVTTNRKGAAGSRPRRPGRPFLEEVVNKKTKIAVRIALWDKLGEAGVNRTQIVNEALEQAALSIGL